MSEEPAKKTRRRPGEAKRNADTLHTVAVLVDRVNRFEAKSMRETIDKIGDELVAGGWL